MTRGSKSIEAIGNRFAFLRDKKVVISLYVVISLILCWLVLDFIGLPSAYRTDSVNIQKDAPVTANKKYPLPPKEHPRVFIRNNDIKDINKRLTSKYNIDTWKRVQEISKKEIKFSRDLNQDIEILQANSFLYLISKDEQNARKAIDGFLAFAMHIDDMQSKYPNRYTRAKLAGEFMVTGAIVYDWCYDALNRQDKEIMISELTSLAKYLETGYPPVLLGSVVGHGSGNPILYHLLSAGIAIYDEKPEMYEHVAKRILDEFVPSRNFIYESGMHHQGNNYGLVRFESELYAALLFKKIGVENLFGDKQKLIPYQWIYARRPDGQLLRDGDTYINYLPDVRWTFINTSFLSAILFKDSYFQNELIKDYTYWVSNPNYIKTGANPLPDVLQLLYMETEEEIKTTVSLPLTRCFGSPIGSMTARTSWKEGKDSDAVVANFKIGEYQFNNHMHLDAGSFQIYYKGALAVDSGVYEGITGGYGSSHDINYNKRTIAHNSLLIYDPLEVFKRGKTVLSNDGGQRIPDNGTEPKNLENLMQGEYETGKVLHSDLGPDRSKPLYSYLSGDITKAYSSKVEQVTRSFLFISKQHEKSPATVIIMDRVTASDPDFKKYFLLHSIQKPEVSGNTSTIKRDENGYRGKLINTTLLPENPKIELVGGENHEFDVFGKNYPNSLKGHGRNEAYEAGNWRIQISPQDKNKSHIFLNVIDIADADYSFDACARLYKDNRLTGVALDSGFCFFSTENQLICDKIDIDTSQHISNTQDKKFFIFADMYKGKWNVSMNGAVIHKGLEVSKDSGVLFFYGIPGKYSIEKQQ